VTYEARSMSMAIAADHPDELPRLVGVTMTSSGRRKRLSIDSAALWIAENACHDIVFNMHALEAHPCVKTVAAMFGCTVADVAAEVMWSWGWPDSRKRKAREIRAKSHV
jgi:hypothetical protein